MISMSFSSSADSSLVRDALSLAFSGSSLVAAAGNDGKSRSNPLPIGCSPIVRPYYPAHYSFVLGVEAGTSGGTLAGFSNCEYELRNPGRDLQHRARRYLRYVVRHLDGCAVRCGTAALLRAYHTGDPAWTPDLVFGQLVRTGGQRLRCSLSLSLNRISSSSTSRSSTTSAASATVTALPTPARQSSIVVTVRTSGAPLRASRARSPTADPLATVVDGTADWGAIGPAAFDDNAGDPFAVDISSATGNNRDLVFDLGERGQRR